MEESYSNEKVRGEEDELKKSKSNNKQQQIAGEK